MKIVFLESGRKEADYVKSKLGKIGKHKIVFFEGELNHNNLSAVKNAEALVLFIGSKITGDVLKELPKLKYIATMSTGYDHIDIGACKSRGVEVSNVPYYGENTVAEHTFGLILNLSRKIYKAIERTKRDEFSLNGLEGFDLRGRTLGVIGAGHIGQKVIKMARGFDMKVIAYDRTPDRKLMKKLGYSNVSLNNLLKNSDIITIHVPLVSGTRHLINMDNIKLIKKGTYLVNTARGEIVDTRALKYALDREILAGAALDVLEGEEDVKDEAELLKKRVKPSDWETFIRNHLLLKDKDVIVTPHSAFYSKEAIQRILDTTVENVKGFLAGRVRNGVA